MKYKAKRIIGFIFSTGILFTLLCVTDIHQAESGENISPGLMKQPLGTFENKIEMRKLQRRDGFSKAIFIEGPRDVPIIIGFKRGETGECSYFLISIDGCEKIVRIPLDSSCIIMDDDHDDGDEHDIPFTLCALDAVIDMLINISECGENEDDDEHEEHEDITGCILECILLMLINIVECIY